MLRRWSHHSRNSTMTCSRTRDRSASVIRFLDPLVIAKCSASTVCPREEPGASYKITKGSAGPRTARIAS